MKRISFRCSKRRRILIITCIVSLLAAGCLHMVSHVMKDQLPHEKVAELWDAEGDTAHISVFFTETEKYALKQDKKQAEFQLKTWYYNLVAELEAATIETAGVENANARDLVYGYSATGQVTLQNGKSNVQTKAYGVGGDFFQFHPLKLVYGSYFSQSDLMQDRIIIDTETSWKLFGSSDVVGMFVTINKVPHMIVGVYERDSGYFNDAAGNDESLVFVSHNTLSEYGEYHGLESVEYLIPNPVTGFGFNMIEQQCSGMDVALVEHQTRFEFLSLWKIIRQFGTRSMGLSGITFPYWENMARGYEDILAGLLMTELVLLAYAGIVSVGFIWYLWLHRKWRVKHIYDKAKDFSYAIRVKRHRMKHNKKSKGEEL